MISARRFQISMLAVVIASLTGRGMAVHGALSYVATDLYTASVPADVSAVFWGSPDLYHAVAAQQAVCYGRNTTTNNDHALLWRSSGLPAIDLHPTGFGLSRLTATNGSQQVGYAQADISSGPHALLWNGTAASAIDLHPSQIAGLTDSSAYGTNGVQQVGYGTVGGVRHALIWNGTAQSGVDLNPSLPNLTGSTAIGTDGIHEVGFGGPPSQTHAVLWSGTAASAVDLNPSGFISSQALGVFGNEQVGYAGGRGFLWHGSAASAVDLTPAGSSGGIVFDTNGTHEVGFASIGSNSHALLWNGTAASFVDLGALLPASFTFSRAYSIDAQNNVFGLASEPGGPMHVIEWSIVPEPASFALLGVVGTAFLGRRRSETCFHQ